LTTPKSRPEISEEFEMRETFELRKKSWLIAAALACFAAPIAFGQVNVSQSQPVSQRAAKLTFDVASIKEWVDGKGPVGGGRSGLQFSGDRIFSNCANLNVLLFHAYHLTFAAPLTGVPSWGKGMCGGDYANTFAIEATMPAGTTNEQSRQMMQNLLADRFKLEAHWEKKDMPILALVIGKGGFKLQPSDPAKDPPRKPGSIGCPPEDPACHNIAGGSGPISDLAGFLSLFAGRPVIDQTGLTSNYNIDLKWANENVTDSPLPSLPAALREKFGLELKPQTAPVNVLVIDHVEKPTPN
jgi:uncharacterized protein (TIGR03435 family)